MKTAIFVLSLALVLLAVCFAVHTWCSRRVLRQLDKMLDDAISGKLDPQHYDESQLSKLEAKLERFLSSSRLKRSQIEEEQSGVHTLISDISHQTKTPVANILLYSQLLREKNGEGAPTEELVDSLAANAEKLDFLLQSLIKASRLESGIIKITPLRQPVAELVHASMAQVAPAARAKDITIDFSGSDAKAMFDAKWCSEALFNILDNAVKYTPAGGKIKVSVQPYEMFVRIDVADTGRGIAEKDLPKLFHRFWRGASNQQTEGVGIGLFLAREIVQACGGYIKAAGSLGGGATFSVFLPSAKGKNINLSIL